MPPRRRHFLHYLRHPFPLLVTALPLHPLAHSTIKFLMYHECSTPPPPTFDVLPFDGSPNAYLVRVKSLSVAYSLPRSSQRVQYIWHAVSVFHRHCILPTLLSTSVCHPLRLGGRRSQYPVLCAFLCGLIFTTMLPILPPHWNLPFPISRATRVIDVQLEVLCRIYKIQMEELHTLTCF
jgi:hypothetical protein